MRRLLVLADDHSEGASTAWEWICAQSWPDWDAEVVTVVDVDVPGVSTVEPCEWEPAVRRAPRRSTMLGKVRHIRASGDARVVLSAVEADLLVIGPRGAGIAKKLHLGSVAEWLINCPPSPMVIARHTRKVGNVVVAADGSAHSHQVIETLQGLPWLASTSVDVVAVETGDGIAAAGAERDAAALAGACAQVKVAVIRPGEWDLTINVRGELMQYLYGRPCDLLAMGTQGLHGWERLRVGSTADYLTHHVDASVLLARCPDTP
jgi:nucleotide-binding universal stress UspA family protein